MLKHCFQNHTRGNLRDINFYAAWQGELTLKSNNVLSPETFRAVFIASQVDFYELILVTLGDIQKSLCDVRDY